MDRLFFNEKGSCRSGVALGTVYSLFILITLTRQAFQRVNNILHVYGLIEHFNFKVFRTSEGSLLMQSLQYGRNLCHRVPLTCVNTPHCPALLHELV